MEGRGKSRRRSPYRVWKRRGSALLAVLLTLSLMLGDISGLSRVVMAGQGTVREEFRIHREDILKAAEEAIENGEPLSEPLAITSEEEKTEEKYQEILPADGSVYEIFPDIEQVKEVDSLELRIFVRLAEGADPASYTLTGDETLVFLYVNGGDVTAEGRVNIDGYVSEFTKVAAFESEEEPMQPGGDTGAAPGNGAAGSGNGSGNSAAGGSGNAGNSTETAESESSESGSMDPEDSAADLDGETEAESEEAGDGTSEDGMSPEETLPAETQEPSQEPGSSAAEETEETEAAEQPSGQTSDDQTDGSEADGTASDENTAEAGTGSTDEDKETAGNTENSDAEDNGTDNESDVKESDAADEASEGNEGSAEDNGQADPADTENENAEADKEDGAEPEKSDTAENADSNAADEDNGAGSTVTLSLRNIQKVAASLASPSEAETSEADESQEEQEESEADEEDSYYEDNGDSVDEEDAAEDEEDIFKKTYDLKGRKYDEAVLDETVTVRAFAAGMEDAGFNREDLLEGAHQLTYTVAEGEARLIYTPEYVRDEAVVTFGIIPAEGMEVYQVTANGETLAETEETAAIASASEAKRAKASSSDADYDEERAVYYQIPQVLEDQTVEIQVVEEGYNDHPAFLQSRTVNGVTVTVSAEEGILPAGTELSVEEVTEQVADAVAEKVEAEAPEEEPISVTSVLAYDINLMLDGKKLANSYWEGNSVSVKFSGERIEETTKVAEKVEVLTLETPTETVEAAFGEAEEMPVVEDVTAADIEVTNEGRTPITVEKEACLQDVEVNVQHFTVYVVIGTSGEHSFAGEANLYVQNDNGNISINGNKYMATNSTDVTFTSGGSDYTLGNGAECNTVYYKSGNNFYQISRFEYFSRGYESGIRACYENRWGTQYVVYVSRSWGDSETNNSASFYWITDTSTISVNVYSRYDGLLEYNYLHNDYGAASYGPSGNDVPYLTVEIDLSQLISKIRNDYPNFGIYSKNIWHYISVACSGYTEINNDNDWGAYKTAVNDFYTKYIYPSMTESSQKAMDEMFPEGTFFGYVLKKESSGWHLDGYFNAQYILEVYNENSGITMPVRTEASDEALNYSEVQKIIGEECDAEIRWETIDYNNKVQTGIYTKNGENYEVTVTFGMTRVKADGTTEVINNAYVENPGNQIVYDPVNEAQGSYLAMFVYRVVQTSDDIPDSPFIRIRKEFIGLENDEIKALDSFKIILTAGNQSKELSIPEGAELKSLANEKGYYYEWQAEGLLTGAYQIVESGYDVPGYIVNTTYNSSASSNITTAESNLRVSLGEGKAVNEQTNSIGNVNLIIAKLSNSQGYLIWSNDSLSDSERDKVLDAIKTAENKIVESNDCYYFSGTQIADGLTIKESTLSYQAGVLKFDLTDQWEKYFSGNYTYNDETPQAEITIINTYTAGVELPETGGPGLIMMERFGWMLLLLALAGAEVQLFSRRRRKEQ